jgi:ferredoxin-NADP reductase
MEKNIVKIDSIYHLTHDVLRIVTGKPSNFDFIPGQATEISIDKTEWTDEKRPFSFTSLPSDDHLEFTIKTYPERKGVTNELLQLKRYDTLILDEVFGAIQYKEEGVFIAGGAGITPFISIFRHLKKKNKIGGNVLIFGNKTKDDIILENEFRGMLGESFINILSEEKAPGYHYGMITEEFLKSTLKNFDGQFYICGPPPMMDSVIPYLSNLGVGKDAVTVEL